jgi:magnesium transporter
MIYLYTFNRTGLTLHPADQLAALCADENNLLWIDVDDPTTAAFEQMAELLRLHPLAVEDTRNDYQRPKVEEYDEHLFIIVNSLLPIPRERTISIEEVDIFLGKNYVITVRSKMNHCLSLAKERLQRPGAFRQPSSGFLFYVIIDVIVDSYFPALEMLENEIQTLEDEIIRHPQSQQLARVLDMKRLVSEIARVTQYQQNMFGVITRHQHDLFFHSDILNYYLRDVHDHLIKSHSISLSHAESLSTLVSLYVSSTSNRLNFIVNRLTIATIVIGIFTVVSGFYGMNFERTWPPYEADWGLPAVVGFMVGAAVTVIAFFRMRRIL